MATALINWSPAPTSLTMIRPLADREFGETPTRAQTVAPVCEAPEPELEVSDRFRTLREHSRGGQGVIHVAYDSQIGREVALKELKPAAAEHPLSRSRFLREAEITGRLDHPGIVPVYAMGKHPDGRPYYTMRLIQGRTLHEAIQQFFDPAVVANPVERNLIFRKILQRFVSVCQTVAYAHSRNIVHRDIKPANILLGSYGEALLADWGLARAFHPTAGCDSDPEIQVDPGLTETPVTDGTAVGSALGTPAFMSPEQANGDWSRVGPASDVYSLGATLYVILTGQSPLPRMPWPEAHRKIVTGDIPDVRAVNPKAPRGLAAICRKAMHVDPAHRYRSAQSLAEDIEHYLADEPVAAEPTPLLERAGRWVRRHRTIVAGATGLWFTLFFALSVGLVVVERERDRKDRAVRYTIDALDRTTSQAVDQWFRQTRDLTSEQKKLLTDLLVDYTRFTEESGSDPVTQRGVVRAFRRVGEIHLRLGSLQESGEALAHAEERGRMLPTDHQSWLEWARVRTIQGYLATAKNHPEQAAKLFKEALDVLRTRAFPDPESQDARAEIASAFNNYGAALNNLPGRLDDAIAAFRSALRLRQELRSASGPADLPSLQLATASTSLGGCLMKSQQFAEAEQMLKQGMEIAGQIVEADPGATQAREELADSALRLGTLYLKTGRQHDAREWLERAADWFGQLAHTYPNDASIALRWAESIGNLRMIASLELSQFDSVLTALARVRKKGATPRIAAAEADVRSGRAAALDRLGRHEEAAAELKDLPDQSDKRAGENKTLRALQLLKAGKVDYALAELEAVVADPGSSGLAAYNAACVYALAASRDAAQARSSRAIELLKLANERGFFQADRTVQHMDRDPDLAILHRLPDYQKWRSSLSPIVPTPTP